MFTYAYIFVQLLQAPIVKDYTASLTCNYAVRVSWVILIDVIGFAHYIKRPYVDNMHIASTLFIISCYAVIDHEYWSVADALLIY